MTKQLEIVCEALSTWERVKAGNQECLMPPDWEDRWHADDGNCEITGEYSNGRDAAEDYVSDGDWGDEPCSISVSVWREAIDLSNGEIIRIDKQSFDVDTPACEEEEPDCRDTEKHDWQSPEWLGGCRENPGVWSTGGTSGTSKSVCANCGAYRFHTWSGPQKNPGEPNETISYEMRDSHSRKWLESEHYSAVLDKLDEAGVDYDAAVQALSEGDWWERWVQADGDAEEFAGFVGLKDEAEERP